MDSEVDVSRFYTRIATAWVLVFWSSMIGLEQPGELWAEGIALVEQVEKNPSGIGQRLPQKNIGTRPAATVDREAFLVSYKRQALAQLDACLQAWKPSPGLATFVAVLHEKTGQLSNLEILGETTELPGCVVSITAAMDFTAVAASMTDQTVILQWTTEW